MFPPLFGFEAITSSILRIIIATSEAELIAWDFILCGSMILAARTFSTLLLKRFIPKFFSPFSCAAFNSVRMSIGSSPAFSAKVDGMHSSAFANSDIASCSRPLKDFAKSISLEESSISTAPPPATTRPDIKALRTSPSPSMNARSISSIMWILPP